MVSGLVRPSNHVKLGSGVRVSQNVATGLYLEEKSFILDNAPNTRKWCFCFPSNIGHFQNLLIEITKCRKSTVLFHYFYYCFMLFHILFGLAYFNCTLSTPKNQWLNPLNRLWFNGKTAKSQTMHTAHIQPSHAQHSAVCLKYF